MFSLGGSQDAIKATFAAQEDGEAELSSSDETGEFDEIDESLLPNLGENVDKIMDDNYFSVQTTMSQGRQMGRNRADISASLTVHATVDKSC